MTRRRLRICLADSGCELGTAEGTAAEIIALILVAQDRLNRRRVRKVILNLTPAGPRMLVAERAPMR